MSGFDIRLFMLSATGLLICLAGVVVLIKQPTARILAVTWSFGGVFLVGGVFGLEGIREFSQFVRVVKPMLEDPGTETYANAFRKVGDGELSDENAEIAAAIAIARPIPAVDSVVEAEASRAADSAGRNALMTLTRNVKAQDSVASRLASELFQSGRLDEQSFLRLDRTAQALVARRLLAQPRVLTQQQERALQEAAKIPSTTRRN